MALGKEDRGLAPPALFKRRLARGSANEALANLSLLGQETTSSVWVGTTQSLTSVSMSWPRLSLIE